MWTRRAWIMVLSGLLAGGAITPVLTGQASPKEKGEKKEKDKDKEKTEKSEPEKPAPSIRVTLTGILATSVPASESTGTEMTVDDTRGITFELDLSRAKELQETARKLNGKMAVAKGALEVREGRFRKLRFILRTTELKQAPKEEGK